MNNLRLLAILCATLGSGVVATGCTTSSGNTDATLRVTNSSDFDIIDLRVTPTGRASWGPNLLNSDLRPGESITLGVACDFYDAMLVDNSNVMCEKSDLDLCANSADWVILNNTCPVFGAAKAARDAAAKAGTAAPDAQ